MDMYLDKSFEEWLRDNGIINRYAKDIKSRVRRASKFIDLNGSNEDEVVLRMTQQPSFQVLSTSVKSQLKRAVLLYKRYRESKLLKQ